jgi:hypothetical protein
MRAPQAATLALLLATVSGPALAQALAPPAPKISPKCATRGIWYLDKGGVRETAEASPDGGKTWKPAFDIVFRPHKE